MGCQESVQSPKVKLPGLNLWWYTPSFRGAATERRSQKETAKRYGNVNLFWKLFAQNGFDRRISGLSQAVRGSDGNVRVAAVQAAQRDLFFEALVSNRPGVFI